jgi:hypothetical protein
MSEEQLDAIREEIARLETMLASNNFKAADGVVLFSSTNAEERRAKLQALLDEAEA